MEPSIQFFLFLLLLFFLLKKKKKVKNFFLPIYGYLTGANDRLYRLLATVKAILEQNGIPYSITGHVLLSAVEKGRLSRGQTEASILIPNNYVEKLLSLNDQFVQLGLGFNDLKDGGYRLSSAIGLPAVTDTAILFFPVMPAGDKWITNSRYLGYNEWYGAQELFPTKQYKLGNLDIAGPAYPVNYLRRNFWNVGIHTKDSSRKRWYQVTPSFYGTNALPTVSRVDYVNGIRVDPRPIDGKNTVVLGSGRIARIPVVGSRYLWV